MNEEVEKYTDVTMSNIKVDEKDKLSLEVEKELRHTSFTAVYLLLLSLRFHRFIAQLWPLI